MVCFSNSSPLTLTPHQVASPTPPLWGKATWRGKGKVASYFGVRGKLPSGGRGKLPTPF